MDVIECWKWDITCYPPAKKTVVLKVSPFSPVDLIPLNPFVLHRWFRRSFPFSQQGGAPKKLCLLVYNPINYRYITYINHSYWSFVHQLNAIVAGGTTERMIWWIWWFWCREKDVVQTDETLQQAARTPPLGEGPLGADRKELRSRQRLVTLFAQIDPKMVTDIFIYLYIYTGWWLTHPSEKYESAGMFFSSIRTNKKCSKPPTSIVRG